MGKRSKKAKECLCCGGRKPTKKLKGSHFRRVAVRVCFDCLAMDEDQHRVDYEAMCVADHVSPYAVG